METMKNRISFSTFMPLEKKIEICTVQHQMCIVQVPYQCFAGATKGTKTNIKQEDTLTHGLHETLPFA